MPRMTTRGLRRYLQVTAVTFFAALAATQAAAQGLAPDPAKHKDAVVQVYGARTMGLKGIFGVHTWIAVKPSHAPAYTIYEIIGWRLRWSDTALVVRERQPDAPWFGSPAELYADKRGPGQERHRYLRREWSYGPYERTVELPSEVDIERANATYGNGIVTIALPKAAARRHRRIEISLDQVGTTRGEHVGHRGTAEAGAGTATGPKGSR